MFPPQQQIHNKHDRAGSISRRGLLQSTAAVAVGGFLTRRTSAADEETGGQQVVTKGRIRQSVMGWCFKPMPVADLAGHCRSIGLVAMEGISADSYPLVRDLGLKISLVGSHGFRTGPFDPDNVEMCVARLRDGIDLAAEVGCPSVITFTGMRAKGVSDEQGAANCVKCWKQVIPHAEEKKINLCLEHLNTRDDTHPMKGHPGYYGDDVDLCIDLIKRVDSPRMKLLFDVYHVQIMNGDVIRRIRQYQDYIGHYHTAGVPGRGELDDTQELNYPAIMKAILETGYTGYVAQEFIPTWSDPIAALRHAAGVCDV
jgi:hydroxypyruvate isomerase